LRKSNKKGKKESLKIYLSFLKKAKARVREMA